MNPCGRVLFRAAGPGRAEFSSQLPVLFAACEHIDFTLPVPGDLNGNVRRGAKPVKTERFAGTNLAEPQRAVADDAGAEQRRRRFIRKRDGNGIGEILRDDGKLRVPSIHVKTGEARKFTQILPAVSAVFAGAAGIMEPWDTHAVPFTEAARTLTSGFYDTHDLMSGNNGQPGRRQLPFDDMKVRKAQPAGFHPDTYFTKPGLRFGRLHGSQRSFPNVGGLFQHHRAHDFPTSDLRLQTSDLRLRLQTSALGPERTQ